LVQDLSNILPADLLNAAEKAAAPPGNNTVPPAPR
jgi:hypothetical protein